MEIGLSRKGFLGETQRFSAATNNPTEG